MCFEVKDFVVVVAASFFNAVLFVFEGLIGIIAVSYLPTAAFFLAIF